MTYQAVLAAVGVLLAVVCAVAIWVTRNASDDDAVAGLAVSLTGSLALFSIATAAVLW